MGSRRKRKDTEEEEKTSSSLGRRKEPTSSKKAAKEKRRSERKIIKAVKETDAERKKRWDEEEHLAYISEELADEVAREQAAIEKKLARQKELQELTKAKKISPDDAKKMWLEDARKIEREKVMGERRTEDEPAVLVGHKGPTKLGQIATKERPYDVEATDIGRTLTNENFTPGKVRFDFNYVLAVSEVELDKKYDHLPPSFKAWGIYRTKRGHSTDEKIKVRGKLVSPFNFNGRLSTLPDFHNGLRYIRRTRVSEKRPDVLVMDPKYCDEHGIYDTLRFSEYYYPTKIVKFGEFRMYVEETSYKTPTGGESFYQALTITKSKSREAMAKAKPNQAAFFLIQMPVKCIDNLIDGTEILMALNKMQPLEEVIPEESGQEGQKMIEQERKKKKERARTRAQRRKAMQVEEIDVSSGSGSGSDDDDNDDNDKKDASEDSGTESDDSESDSDDSGSAGTPPPSDSEDSDSEEDSAPPEATRKSVRQKKRKRKRSVSPEAAKVKKDKRGGKRSKRD